jgi:hypothetical protein
MNIVFTFYRNFIWPATFISLLSGFLILSAGSGRIGIYLFWMKILTSFGLGIFFHLFQSQQLYFYNNLGYSKTRLYICTAALDLFVWVAITVVTLLIV